MTIYNRAILPVILYAAEAWSISTSQRSRLKLCQIQRSFLMFATKAYKTIIMPGKTVCAVPTCESKGYVPQKHIGRKLSFHRLPLDKARQKVWIERVNPALSTKTQSQLRCQVVCSLHFAEDKYMSPISNRLVHDAVPEFNLPFFSPSETSTPSASRVASPPTIKNENILDNGKIEDVTIWISEWDSSGDSNSPQFQTVDLLTSEDISRQNMRSPDFTSLPGTSSTPEDPLAGSLSSTNIIQPTLIPEITLSTPSPQCLSSIEKICNIIPLSQEKRDDNKPITEDEVSSESEVKQSNNAMLETSEVADALKRLEDISTKVNQISESDDHFDHFGKYVASLVKCVPAHEAIELQQSIINLILMSDINSELSVNLNPSVVPSSSTNFAPEVEAGVISPFPKSPTSLQKTLRSVKKASCHASYSLFQQNEGVQKTPPEDDVKAKLHCVELETLEELSNKINQLDESNGHFDKFARYVASLLRSAQTQRAMELQLKVVELILRPQINSLRA
ncbi:hypothetical protein C0J52_14035 [Blattella germanica]|nr:hypothetical protein C0J52_14035 [Blattella germanica]